MLSNQTEIAASPQALSGQPDFQFFLTALAKDNSPAVLQQTALSVRIDKAVAQVKSVRSVKDDPLLFAVVVDVSKSDASIANSITEAAFRLFQGLASAHNQGYLVLFNHDVATTEAPISVSEAKKALDSATFAGGTALYDAVEITCRQRLSRSENPARSRRVILLISDGEDNSSHATRTKAEQAALEEGVSVFSVLTNDPMSIPRGERVLKEISQTTGGFAIEKDLRRAVALSLAAIKAQWVVTLVSTQSADRNLHSMQITCTQKDVRISAPSSVLLE
jgi:VWFA-related protein